ncbi:hypothetical protein Y032_0048g1557 [Ancylostoma ceylanicum]|uniref:Uncharacterized protein n=1 Tax=Ancylostoma ceylanicum TaxID=53326 RepID=A0A016UAP6_9BILA|nr:hypothetical protein Y032_0048g1557 [Ancylostoma ceylanicum]
MQSPLPTPLTNPRTSSSATLLVQRKIAIPPRSAVIQHCVFNSAVSSAASMLTVGEPPIGQFILDACD